MAYSLRTMMVNVNACRAAAVPGGFLPLLCVCLPLLEVLLLNLSVRELAILIPVILASLTVHELSHAVVSLALGDDTAKRAGRVTLNPLRHVDPFGFLLLVVAGFGWAKPVTFDRSKLSSPVRDEILVSFAGPASNLVLAFLGALAIRLIVSVSGTGTGIALEAAFIFCSINIVLAVFNALPVPPLDGSHLYMAYLSKRNPTAALALSRYGFLFLVVLIFAGRFTGVDLLPIRRITQTILTGMLRVVGV